MTDQEARVVVVGSVNVDLATTVRRHPQPGETVLGSDLRRTRGGKGANQAMAAARAGAAVSFVGRVGDDADGAAYRDALQREGIDVEFLVVTPGVSTGSALIVVDEDAENSIVVAPGANARVGADDVRAAAKAIAGADVLLLQLEIGDEAVAEALAIAGDHGVRVVLNPSPVRDVPAAWVAAADPLVVNEHEAAAFGVSVGHDSRVCVTRGGRGASWYGETVAPPPVRTVDTTGAGDAFAGALAAALARGAEPEEALHAAVRAGAEATTWRGAQPG